MAGYIYMASPTHEVFNASFFGGGSNSSCPSVIHAELDGGHFWFNLHFEAYHIKLVLLGHRAIGKGRPL